MLGVAVYLLPDIVTYWLICFHWHGCIDGAAEPGRPRATDSRRRIAYYSAGSPEAGPPILPHLVALICAVIGQQSKGTWPFRQLDGSPRAGTKTLAWKAD